ncbi:Uncharacterized protein OBRU01_13439 [Operophtera brumata]|uniref:Uncharacterized protein n=1 Tax=Operophtera brumata TaxID=104452 RepID=A0A0L7KZT5_OPEBR|nr:Uncharacterized protein OBRU01_13439 [Operophtera brumata]
MYDCNETPDSSGRACDPCRGQPSSYGGFASASSDDDTIGFSGEYMEPGELSGRQCARARAHAAAACSHRSAHRAA